MNHRTPLLGKISRLTNVTGPEYERRLAFIFLIPFLAILASLLIFFILREERRAEEVQLAELREAAAAFYEQIAVTRLWNARHGGLYAEVTPETHRNIVTTSGRQYTRINPAYVTRELSEIARKRRGYKFRIVGLRSLNPANMPDAWESEILGEFEQGRRAEATAVVRDGDGNRIFEYFVPLKIEEPCLKCHGRQGFRQGDVKGGISVMIPMEKWDSILSVRVRQTVLALMLLGAASIGFVTLITVFLSRKLASEIARNTEREKLTAVLELAGATAHEMRQPMTIVSCMLGIVKEKTERNEPVTEEDLDIVHSQCNRMNNIIEQLTRITEYRTKAYCEGIKILDLDQSSQQPDTAAGRQECTVQECTVNDWQ